MQGYNYKHQKAFTLVELAIVMTIIGLLIGGILKGQELLENARVTSTIAQIKSFEAATTAFRDIYGEIPGDLPNAESRIPGCVAACNPPYAPEAGNGKISNSFLEDRAAVVPFTAVNSGQEANLFWMHLLKANLIVGVTDQELTDNSIAPAWGVTHPAAKIGGGYHVGYQYPSPGDEFVPGQPSGIEINWQSPALLALLSTITVNTGLMTTDPGAQVLTAARAGQIDRKMDDGMPATGNVFAYGVTTSCFADASSGSGYVYQESGTSKDCGLIIKLQQ